MATITTNDGTEVIVGPRYLRAASAYDIWLAEGNTGTEQDYLDSIAADATADAETAQAAAEAAQAAAETAQTGAETAETNAETAQAAAETAQGLSETAQTASEAAQTASESAQSAAETAQTGAEAARDKAEDWAEEAEDVEVETGQYSAKHHALKASTAAAAAETAIAGLTYPVAETIGAEDIAAGTGTLSSGFFILDQAATLVATSMTLTGYFNAISSTEEALVWDKDGDDWTVSARETFSVTAGENTVSLSLAVTAGQYVGLKGGNVRFGAGTTAPGWFNGTTGSNGDFTDASAVTSAPIRVRFTLNGTIPADVDIRPMPVYVTRDGDDTYVRQHFDATRDVVRRLKVGETPSATLSGTVDHERIRLIPFDTLDANTIAAFDASTEIYMQASDHSPPERLNGMYLGGNHGVVGRRLTKTSHGLNATDVGDTGTDGAAKSWVLTNIVDADTIEVIPANTGTATAWVITGAITGSTITFANAGAFTFTADSSFQVYPYVADYSVAVYVDGVAVAADGTGKGQRAEIRESYKIPNPADWLTTLIAERGTGTPKEVTDAAIDRHIDVSFSHQFDRYGSNVIYVDHYVLQDYARGSADYWGGQQWQAIYRLGGETLHQYVPDLSGTVGGYDLTGIADITSNSSAVTVPRSSCVDADNPASHFTQQIQSGGSPVRAFSHGYARHIGIGVPATRAAVTTDIFELSSSEKQYPYAVDAGAGATASAGEHYTAVCWNAIQDMSGTPDETVNSLVEYADGTVHWIIDLHRTATAEWFDLPDDLIGRPVTVLDSTGFTLISDDVVTPRGLRVSVPGSYGRAVVEIGR
jgi:hypothetical protein